MKILVAGGAGFIGSNFIHYLIENYLEDEVVNFDKLTYAGNLENLKDLAGNARYSFVKGDIADSEAVEKVLKQGIDVVVNFAAETHVDRSIHIGSRDFVLTNTLGVQTLLDAERQLGTIKRHVQISTDEVYGSLELEDARQFHENWPFQPNVPYAAAKAGGDLLCRAFFKTFGLDVVVTHCSNNYGPYQYPEKLIPFFIDRAMNDQPLPLYGDGKNVRDWLYVRDHCEAIDLVLRQGKAGEVYNIGGHFERPNLEIARLILKALGKPESLITFVTDRPGHDRRYAIDASKIAKELGWKPRYHFSEAVKETIQWYRDNQDWVNRIKARAKGINAHLV
ncbi:dTDP-glucose 4,6-dehydratase [Candidatus Uhrbacteria bacterium RIFCSPLOWO2_12_FULL_46_10]|uniref:dTDP-glucose 4,6-dehydratase n=1 Tax=Candidatus Uhrbacteria bacterium RIFCSPLOWO2_01_FULL_47_25 TaxID=1802402 RepID=A0A1F7URI5_9BACT|nr:MAG: dTDP-glucose 4,6-dehydratase [Candidatus Uhrbacteria bacterium RIFCSPHIGHO2_01_FULL_46_23]OGL69236.1 MAG: dTDP-glucose 4,6-dehydratase [Candidatus Uhrbacteria bacterium RIFCSPHIGHO2_02_FULL_47_29]OGL75321.1 MAG: dTDP-glucose 4,6-dehydratase [Candidatus Uhrbacteria bacterium RIFCSPHIGHO2_12_FULL_46_13]OGL80307.1 MAG: dTDP-glucose 4,6-dehydratase [Candidatus Uhrbacteria bacterium RIFCSPLOWO2_01_FULL_47_25]OGL85374.1 MAG: dTDP-glucose 4,6-dehydratase [Candidatus Uhrbacteria bacterium RIFCS